MTKAARTSFAGEFWMGPSGGLLVKFSELTKVGQPNYSRSPDDVTTHDSSAGFDEFILTDTIDSGEIAIEGYYIAGSTDDTALLAAAVASGATALRDFKVVAKGAGVTRSSKTFSGYVTGYKPGDLEIRGKQGYSATIKITGAVTQGAPV